MEKWAWFSEKVMLNKMIERDDNSTKCHHAWVTGAGHAIQPIEEWAACRQESSAWPIRWATRHQPRVTVRWRFGIVVLALAPQIFEFLWSFGTIFGFGSRPRSGAGAAGAWRGAVVRRPRRAVRLVRRGRQEGVFVGCAARADLFLPAVCRRDRDRVPQGPHRPGLYRRRRADARCRCSRCGLRAICRACADFPSAPEPRRGCSGC